MPFNWFLDFDDTLVSGSTTWGMERAIPKLVQEHRLPFDLKTFKAAALVAQEQVAGQAPNDALLDSVVAELFEKLGWPQELRGELLRNVMSAYQPTMFDDSLPFLERLSESGQTVSIISNNGLAPEIAAKLGIHEYITAFFTPAQFPGTQPKPHRSLWDKVLTHYPQLDPQQSVIVGDDPWSDGVFAEACGLNCWIVDRRGSFTSLYDQKPYRWVKSLAEIQIDEGIT